jgi:ribose 5-phosphate isomerase RpiB
MQIGSAVGLAALVSLGTGHTDVLRHAGVDQATAAAHGYALSFAVVACVTGFGALLALVGIRPIAAAPAVPETRTVREATLVER